MPPRRRWLAISTIGIRTEGECNECTAAASRGCWRSCPVACTSTGSCSMTTVANDWSAPSFAPNSFGGVDSRTRPHGHHRRIAGLSRGIGTARLAPDPAGRSGCGRAITSGGDPPFASGGSRCSVAVHGDLYTNAIVPAAAAEMAGGSRAMVQRWSQWTLLELGNQVEEPCRLAGLAHDGE